MVTKASERGVYDQLAASDALAFLAGSEPSLFDVILAADAFCYFGDLGPILDASARALAPDGLIAFSVETEPGERMDGEGFRLRATMRFTHDSAYLTAAAETAGLRPLLLRRGSARSEIGTDAPGLVGVFERGVEAQLGKRNAPFS